MRHSCRTVKIYMARLFDRLKAWRLTRVTCPLVPDIGHLSRWVDTTRRHTRGNTWLAAGAVFAFTALGYQQVSQVKALSGVGRLYRGHRNLGCVGYSLQNLNGQRAVVRFDPMPDAAQGDVFHLTLQDGRILECQVLEEYTLYCAVLDGPRTERRHHRRPTPTTRAYM